MRANYYRRKDTKAERYVVGLWWQGKYWTRTNYDERLSISSKIMADRLCHEINGAIEKYKKGFNPRKFFGRGYELKFKNYWPKWLVRRELQPITRDHYERVLLQAEQALGNLDIEEIKRAHIEDFLNSVPGKTFAHAVLHALFQDAFEREDIDRVPGFPKLKSSNYQPKTVSPAIQELVLSKIPAHDYPIFKFTCTYGTRVSESIALMWDCIFWDEKRLVIRRTVSGRHIREYRKANDWLYLPLTDEIEAILRKIHQFNVIVFLNKHGRQYKRQYLDATLRTACKEAAVPEMGLHAFARHSLGNRLINEGASLEQIQYILGHKNRATTQRYARMNMRGIRGLVR